MNLVFGAYVSEWANKTIPGNPGFDNPYGIGIMKGDKLVGAVVYDNYRPATKTVSVSIVLTDKTALQKNRLRYFFDYPFEQLGVKRLVLMIEENNKPSINLATQLGFVREGVLRRASILDTDVLVFGMLRNECKWLTCLRNT